MAAAARPDRIGAGAAVVVMGSTQRDADMRRPEDLKTTPYPSTRSLKYIIAILQKLAVAEPLQSSCSVRGPLEALKSGKNTYSSG